MDIVRAEFTDSIDAATVGTLIDNHRGDAEQAHNLMRYYKGGNPYIMDRKSPDLNAPDNKVPVSYARKIINTVLGYMYKPGLVRYTSKNQKFMDTINEVFKANREPIKTAQLGKQASLHGVGYEYHYVGGQPGDEKIPLVAMPRFCMLPAEEVIPIYDYEVEPNLTAFIRYFTKGDIVNALVYYPKRWELFVKDKEGTNFTLSQTGVHPYPTVPLVVYQNNEERIGDVNNSIRRLIDAYDVLMSDSMNEFDRFAWAYLVMKGFGLNKGDARNIKLKRAFENLAADDAVSFLTKDINSDFIKFMAEWIRAEIHIQSGIPDISDISFGSSASGTTIDKFIYLMELFCDPKEALFRQGLQDRLRMIDSILTVRDGTMGTPDEIEVTMDRNWPVDDTRNADALQKYSGHVTEKTLLTHFAPFVQDVDKEIEELAQQKDEALQRIQAQFDARADNNPDNQQDMNANSGTT